MNSGATLNPGSLGSANTGILTMNSLNLQTGAHLVMEINGTTAGALADQLVTTRSGAGTLTLAGDLKLTIGGAYVPGGSDSIILVANNGTGAVTGAFSSVTVTDNSGTNVYSGLQGTMFALNGQEFAISYTAGDGNDFGVYAVPEPNSLLILACGAGMLLLIQRRRRRSC